MEASADSAVPFAIITEGDKYYAKTQFLLWDRSATVAAAERAQIRAGQY